MKNPLSGIKAAISQARNDLDGIRDRIASLKAQREDIEGRPIDVVEIERRVDEAINKARHDEHGRPRHVVKHHGFHHRDWPFSTVAMDFKSLFANPFEFFAAYDPERLKRVLLEGMPTNGLSDVDRSAEIARLDRDLLAAEIAEEVLLREMESSTGAAIFRRRDANPAVLLAPDSELN